MDAHLFNSLTEGDFNSGFVLMQSLMEGDFWLRQQGCYAVYRGEDCFDNLDYDHIVAVTESAGELNILPGGEFGQEVFYGVRHCSSTGKQERGTLSTIRLSLNEEGQLCNTIPNAVCNLSVSINGEHSVSLQWFYSAIGQQVSPDCFKIFSDAGAGTIDYGTAAGEVIYDGSGAYKWSDDVRNFPDNSLFAVCVVGIEGQISRGKIVKLPEVNPQNSDLLWSIQSGF